MTTGYEPFAFARAGGRETCGPISPFSGRDCVKSLRSSYTELHLQMEDGSQGAVHTPESQVMRRVVTMSLMTLKGLQMKEIRDLRM